MSTPGPARDPVDHGADGGESPPVRDVPRKLAYLIVALVVSFGVDQATKAWVASSVDVAAAGVPVVDGFFYITHMRNSGTALGFFQDLPVEIRRIGFSLLAVAAGWVVVVFYRGLAPSDRVNGLAVGCLVGGGLGNLVDRLTRGEVIDFLHFRLFGPWSFPDFNFADVFIIVGVAMLLIELLVSEGAVRAEIIDAHEEHSEHDAR